MIFKFSDGEFSGPIATSMKMWKKINSFIVTNAFSVTLEKLNKNSQAWCPPPPTPWISSKRSSLAPTPTLKALLSGPWTEEPACRMRDQKTFGRTRTHQPHNYFIDRMAKFFLDTGKGKLPQRWPETDITMSTIASKVVDNAPNGVE